MILAELIEKKDILNFIGLRLENLDKAEIRYHNLLRDPNLSNKKKKHAQAVIERFKGRKNELRRLKGIVHGNNLKPESKKMWRSLNIIVVCKQ